MLPLLMDIWKSISGGVYQYWGILQGESERKIYLGKIDRGFTKQEYWIDFNWYKYSNKTMSSIEINFPIYKKSRLEF